MEIILLEDNTWEMYTNEIDRIKRSWALFLDEKKGHCIIVMRRGKYWKEVWIR